MNKFYRVALVCGAVPLLVGVSIFVLWLITRSLALMFVGIFLLYAGVSLFLVGAVALACSVWRASKTPDLPRRRLWRSTLGCAGLLLVNFPVAGAIAGAVLAIETAYTVVVHNDSNQPLHNVRVFGGGGDEALGTVPPGGVVQRTFWIQHDGQLQIRASQGKSVHVQVIDGYVTHNMGGHRMVTIRPDGTISVRDDGAQHRSS